MRALTKSQSLVIQSIQSNNPSFLNNSDGSISKYCKRAIEQLKYLGLVYRDSYNILSLTSKFHKLSKEENNGIISIDLRGTMTIDKLKSLISDFSRKDNIYKSDAGYTAIIKGNITHAKSVKELYYKLQQPVRTSFIPDYQSILNIERPSFM